MFHRRYIVLIWMMTLVMIQNCPWTIAKEKAWTERFQSTWRVNVGEKADATEKLAVRIFETANSEFEIRFYRKDRLISSVNSRNSNLGIYPESLNVLADGNLVSLWTSGNAYNIVNIFNWDGKNVRQVLREDSKLIPEILLDNRLASGVLVKESCKMRYPIIVISKVDWVKTKEDEASVLKPVSANLYWWNAKSRKYDCKKNVPWQLRTKG